jgi:predicted glycoside hydrolase/deacetylase ChbG (UPF0249 family)
MSATLAERLGFAAEARVAVVHADDIGMCHAANEGAFEVLAKGPATCGSIMVPCPWFAEAAARARDHGGLDLGVHLTLNAEWDTYRWGPVAGATAVPSLVDARGHLHRTTAETLEHADPAEVEVELRAQIQRALDEGVDVTHIDSHMGTVFFPPLVEVYAKLAREFRVPAFLVRPRARDLGDRGPADVLEPIRRAVDALEADGFPVLDGFDADSLGFAPGAGPAHNRARLAKLGPGVSYLICHPARGGAELEAMTEDAHCRDFERGFYGGEAGREALAAEGIETVGMRALRDLLREGRPS